MVGALVRQRSGAGEAGKHSEQEASVESVEGFHVVECDDDLDFVEFDDLLSQISNLMF